MHLYRIQNDGDDYLNDRHAGDSMFTSSNQRRRTRWLYFTTIVAVGALIAVGALAYLLHKAKSESTATSGNGDVPSAYVDFLQTTQQLRDNSISPCDDFYLHACNQWLSSHTIPNDKLSVDRSFSTIADNNNNLQMTISYENWPIIGDFFNSCINLDAIENVSISSIQPYLNQINAITDLPTLFTTVGNLQTQLSVSMFFGMGVSVDVMNPSRYQVIVSQDGATSLPSLSSYSSANVIGNFTAHVARIFSMLDSTLTPAQAQAQAQTIVAFEQSLASKMKSPADMRDPVATYNPLMLSDLKSRFASIPWVEFFTASSIPAAFYGDASASPASSITPVNMDNPAYFTSLSTLLTSTPTSTLVLYAKWRLVHSVVKLLPARFVNEDFDFFSRQLLQQPSMLPRNQTCVRLTDAYLGDILGRIFVERAFGGASKDIVLKMIGSLKQAFAMQLSSLSWMDPNTRTAALYKLFNISDLVGYPSKWETYAGVSLGSSIYFSNTQQLRAFSYRKDVARLGKPVDKTVFQMTPATVNAYYDPTLNSINFPAGILQPNFFSASYPTAANMGGIGLVIGHEISHGFDDQGSQFDAQGKMRNWWSDSTKKQFQDRSTCLVNQYSQFTVEGINVNGNLTLGENIADNAGLSASYIAFQLSQQQSPDPNWSSVSSITPNQLFFLSFAQSWCSSRRPAYAKQLLENDPHSPPHFRVNAPLMNFAPFAQAFNCPVGSKMNPSNKCLLWYQPQN